MLPERNQDKYRFSLVNFWLTIVRQLPRSRATETLEISPVTQDKLKSGHDQAVLLLELLNSLAKQTDSPLTGHQLELHVKQLNALIENLK